MVSAKLTFLPTALGRQPQRSLEHFSIGKDLIPREMINA
jgi:hypothetical protein